MRTRPRRLRRTSTPRTMTASATAAVGVAALLAVLGGGWALAVGPATADLAEARADLVDAQDSNDLLAVRLARLEQQRDDLGPVSALAEELTAYFPPTADQPGFFRMVDRAARAAGIGPDQVTTLSPTVPVVAPAGSDGAAAELALQSVVITVDGTYEQGQRLLQRLERLDRSFLVQSVTVSGEGPVTVSITGSTFVAPAVLPPEAATGGAG